MLRVEKALFTLFILLLLSWAVYVAKDWPLRTSIIILVLGSVGVVLALAELILELAPKGRVSVEAEGITFDAPTLKPKSRWGNLEIWGWILGFYATIHLIGFPVAVPAFVFAYAKVYGARWMLALTLAALSWGFVYTVFDQLLHVPWPKSVLFSLIWS